MLKKTFFLGFIVSTFMLSPLAFADKFTFIIEKQDNKAKDRWSIADWTETRDKMRLMDLWLSLHSPSPYEFYLATAYKTGSLTAGGNYQGWDFVFAAYAYFIGIELQRQTSNLEPRWLGVVNLRLFGAYNQATNLTLQGGLSQQTFSGTSEINPVAGANLTLYIGKPFGGEVLYRRYFARSGGIANNVDHLEAGAFIDFRFIRIYGDYIAETEYGDPTHSFQGFQLGTRLYF